MPRSELIDQRKEWSKRRLESFKEEVSEICEVTRHADLCIYVTGSFGRLEASEYSDLDLFFIERSDSDLSQMTRIDKTLMDASLITKCRDMRFPEGN